MNTGKVSYPPDHQPGMEVPEGGSMCANCKYLGEDKKTCTEKNFIRWNGSDVIPGKITAYCSDWWESNEKKFLSQAESNKMSMADVLNSLRPALAESKQ